MEGGVRCRENNLGSRQSDHSSASYLVKNEEVGVLIHQFPFKNG